MDYQQKYLKYKAKYIALQEGGSGVADLTGILIPPELQALDDAFLPGFNIDKEFVQQMLDAAKVLDTQGLVDFLLDLNNKSKSGLCKDGNRNNKAKKTKSEVESAINGGDSAKRDEALKRYKEIEAIRIYPVEKIKSRYPNFQAIDDAFLPDFNIDKAYVGHLYYFAKYQTAAAGVIDKLQELHKATHKNGGLNGKGDRLSIGQKKQKYEDIKKNLQESLSDSAKIKTMEAAKSKF